MEKCASIEELSSSNLKCFSMIVAPKEVAICDASSPIV